MKQSTKKIIFVCVFLAGSFQISVAQELNLFRLNTGIIQIAKPSQLADTLSVWGDVRRAGRYVVPRNTNLMELLSMAKGPAGFSGGGRRDVWSNVELKVYVSRYSESLDNFQIKTFNLELDQPFPPGMKHYSLQNGDVITIKADQKATFRDYFSIIAPIITLGFTSYLFFTSL